MHNVSNVKEAWINYKNNSNNNVLQQCLVTGKVAPIARLHPKISGLYKGHPSGNVLVSFNKKAFESYNASKELRQGLNAPVSEYAAFAYGTALNSLLADESHKIIIGDVTVVFWAEQTPKIIRICSH